MDYDDGNRNNPERTIRQATKLCINPLSTALLNNFKLSAWAAEWKFTNNCYAMFHSIYKYIITLKCRYTFIKPTLILYFEAYILLERWLP